MSDEPVDVECVIIDRNTGVKSPPYRACRTTTEDSV